jgi:hypothetical protein
MCRWQNPRVPLLEYRQELRISAFDSSIRPPVRHQSTDFSSAPTNFVFSGEPPTLLSLCSSFFFFTAQLLSLPLAAVPPPPPFPPPGMTLPPSDRRPRARSLGRLTPSTFLVREEGGGRRWKFCKKTLGKFETVRRNLVQFKTEITFMF